MTPRTIAHQASLFMEFSRQEYWSGLPFPSPGDLPHPWIKPSSPALQADSLLSEPPRKHQKISSVLVHSVTSNSATPWTIVHQAPLSMEFSSQEYWSRLPFPTLGDVPDPGIKFEFLASPAWAGRFFTIEPREELQRVRAWGKNMYRKQHSEYRVVRLRW